MSKRNPDIEKNCIVCGRKIERKRFKNGRIEDYGDYKRRKHCDQKCMGKSNLPKEKKIKIQTKLGYVAIYSPNHHSRNKWGYVNEHILVAEKALKKVLPMGAVVHHVNGTRNSGPLVICQDSAYHMLLHQRQRAYEVCGHASWRKCYICKKWDKPENMVISIKPRGHNYHKNCAREYEKERIRLKCGKSQKKQP